ncbi:G-protein coupled receptor 22 [Kryptolebias marmoratus]|uniref:G-protein coupled receptor 22 n=1 Tax=Kryptolebias marmoratus TaxID=37003 RepID=A0A3Q3BFE2_KRYMA|nr:G-protein coupled receptor 22 [Kryptolebias marmoratus]XP_037831672.1 G-protein coupled receptor 22 [Kryptolebias marmoratus]
MHTPTALISAPAMSDMMVLDTPDTGSSENLYPIGFQVSLTSFLVLEMVLGLTSNLTVLVLYCMKHNLISSVSNIITMNLHVVDVLVCVCCIPLTAAVVLLPPEVDKATISCFHEAFVSFASVATAANVLAITVDRYDISVRPANRVLTMSRAVALMGTIWVLSFFSFLVPFMEVGFFVGSVSDLVNQTAADANEYYTEPGLYYHLLAQIPIFFFTAAVMLMTYYKILQALNIRIGARFQHNLPKKKLKSKNAISLTTATQAESTDASQSSTGVKGGGNAPIGIRASVSVIIALRRAMKRHRERRERQKRVFRMSLLIISTFLLCWTPITVLNVIILSTGPSGLTFRLRLGFLVMAYGTTIFHPLLYAFTRQKFQKVLKSKMKKRAVSVVEAEPTTNNAVIRNSWIDPRRHKKVTFEDPEARQKCLCSPDTECK